MRIIAGNLGGRNFSSPKGNRTHPMGDKVRGGLFNALGDLAGLTVLDAFAGCGAVGFEAISRGARSAVCIEHDRSAAATIAENIRQLGLGGRCKLIQAGVSGWLRTSSPDELFDVIVCDPPYDDTQLPVIAALCGRLSPDGTMALSWPGKEAAPELGGLRLVRQKNYGDAQLLFYQRDA